MRRWGLCAATKRAFTRSSAAPTTCGESRAPRMAAKAARMASSVLSPGLVRMRSSRRRLFALRTVVNTSE